MYDGSQHGLLHKHIPLHSLKRHAHEGLALAAIRQQDLERGAILPRVQRLEVLIEAFLLATWRVNEPGGALEHPTKDIRSVLANVPLGPVVTTSYVVMKTVEERLRLLDGDVAFATHSVHLLDDLETDHDAKVDVKAARL